MLQHPLAPGVFPACIQPGQGVRYGRPLCFRVVLTAMVELLREVSGIIATGNVQAKHQHLITLLTVGDFGLLDDAVISASRQGLKRAVIGFYIVPVLG